jgi:hypothetical protein
LLLLGILSREKNAATAGGRPLKLRAVEISPRNFGAINPLAARLALHTCIAAAGLILGIWLLAGGIDNRSSDSPAGLICGAILIPASMLLLNFSIRFFLKYRR